MKKKIFLCVIFIVSAMLLPQEKKYSSIKAGTIDNYPPFCIINEEGQADGFSVELLREACKAVDIEVLYLISDWATARSEIGKGNIDVLPITTNTPERAKQYGLSSSYITLRGAIFVRSDDSTIKNLDDLSGKTVAVMEKTTSEEYVRKNFRSAKVITTESNDKALAILSEGGCDAVVTQKLMGSLLLKEKGLEKISPKIGLDDLVMKFCFAVRKDNPELLSLINEGLLLIMTDGTYEQLYNKWFEPKIDLTRSKLIAGGDSEYPPYSFLDENGNPAGYDVDLMRAVAKELGVLIDIQLKPWSDVMADLKDNRIDFIQGILKNKQREKYLTFSTPNAIASYVVFARKGTVIPEDISTLTGKVIIQENDYFYDIAKSEGYFEDRIINVHSHNEAVKKLSSGVADYAVLAKIPALNFITKAGIKNIIFSDKIFANPFWCSAAKQGNENLIVNINNALANLKASGEYGRIYDKWFSAYEKQEYNYRKMIMYSLAILIPVLVLVIVVIAWNRTLKRKVEERTKELTASQKIFDEFFEHSPIYVYFKNKDLRSLKLSRNFEQMLGRPLEELLNKTMDELFPSDLAKKMIEDDKKILKEGKLITLEEELNGRNYITLKFPILMNGSPEYLAGYTIDITEKIQAENKLKESEEKYRKMFEHAREGILITCTDGRNMNANPEACRLLGMTEEEIIIAGRKGLIDETDPNFPKMYEIRKNTGFVSGELKFKRKNGTIFIAKITSNIFRNSLGEERTITTFSDISERKEYEDKLKETADELRQMNGFMVDRELKMVELKEEINQLLKAAGKPEKY